MTQIYTALYALVNVKSGAHAIIAGVGLIAYAVYQFSTDDPADGTKSFMQGLGLLGIGGKQHATAGEVAKVVDATVTPDVVSVVASPKV